MSNSRLLHSWTNHAECSVWGMLYTVFRLSRLFGVAPVKFTKASGVWRMSLSQAHAIVMYAVVTVLNVVTVLGLIVDLKVDPEKSTRARVSTRRLVWVTEIFLTQMMLSYSSYCSPGRIKTILQCLNQVHEINSHLKPDQRPRKERKASALMLSVIVFLVSVMVLDCWVFYRSVWRHNRDRLSAVLYSCYFISYFMPYLLLIQFVFVSLEACKSLKTLNDFLYNLSKCCKHDSHTIVRQAKSDYDHIRQLVLTCDKIFELMREIDRCFSVELLLLLVCCFQHLVITPYNFIVNLKGERLHLELLIIQFIWCGIHMITAMLMVEPSHKTMLEIERTHRLVGQLTIKTTDQLVSSELDKFSRYLVLNRVSYSPMGICTLSRSLMTTVAGSVATYLVIVVQFQGPDDGEY